MRLEELRSTLNEHADGLEDAPQARIAPVRRRVAAARRRRAAAVAGVGVVAVVAAALTVVPRLVDREVAPADRVAPARLAGRAGPGHRDLDRPRLPLRARLPVPCRRRLARCGRPGRGRPPGW